MQYARTPVRKQLIAANTSNAAGATVTGTTIDNNSLHRATIVVRTKNGATAPTAGLRALLQVQVDNSGVWYTVRSFAGGVNASEELFQSHELPPCIRFRVIADSNTGQAVTVDAYAIAYSRY